MPDAVAREARERLPAALARHGFTFPRGKVLFNLVPAQLPKRGLPLDLALAVALLVADGQLPALRSPILFLAELDLKGCLGPPSRGTLLAAMAAKGRFALLSSPEGAAEAALAPGMTAWGASDLGEVAAILRNPERARAAKARPEPEPAAPRKLRLDDVRGQPQARMAAAVAAAGRHPLLLQGPPGTGKSLLARRVISLLPPLSGRFPLELAQVEALFGAVRHLPRRPPLRAPHMSISAQGLLGGGHPLRPGEISRAHGGVLFLDELPEFNRTALEGLRQPLEDREVRLERARESARFPADFLLVAARNPCPCGYSTHPRIPCTCPPSRLERYLLRTSGPLLDRFDLFVEMGPISGEAFQGARTPPADEAVHALLQRAWQAQTRRQAAGGAACNGAASREDLMDSGMEPAASRLLARAIDRFPLSGRASLRCLRVARTLADMQGRASIGPDQVKTALSFRFQPAEKAATRGYSLRPGPGAGPPPVLPGSGSRPGSGRS